MSASVMQHSFHAGEWAPALNARVDIAKYKAGAAAMRNFYVDYRGGASTRAGTKWILQAYKSATAVRLISFAASSTVQYILEFGDGYIRFFYSGAPVLETAKAITAATQANPAVVTSNAHGYSVGDWVFITGVVGMTQLNGRYFLITAVTANTFTLGKILDSSAVDSSAYTAYTSGGTVARIYTLPSPYLAADLATLKFSQSVNKMVFVHPSYSPYELIITSAANWTISAISFGSTVRAPTGLSIATSSAGSGNLSYVVTAVDINGQESIASSASSTTINTAGASVSFGWGAVSGAVSYNVYRTGVNFVSAPPAGSAFGFAGNTTGTTFIDTFGSGFAAQIPVDFDVTQPVAANPFQGAGVASVTVTAAGTYTTVPTVTLGAAPTGGQTATATAVLSVQGTPTVSASGSNYAIGDKVFFANGVVAIVATINGTGGILTLQPITYPGSSGGSITSGSTPANPMFSIGTSGAGAAATFNLTWGVGAVNIVQAGAGYAAAPAVTFGSGAATATSVLAAASAGNPSAVTFFQQRLVLAAATNAPQTFNMSQPGSPYNFNISSPIQADDAITGSIISQQLNTIKSMIPMSKGLIALADHAAWLINGGSDSTTITPINANAQAQAYSGASDVPPIVVNSDILYIQAKGSNPRDLTFNFYTNIYTGADIGILSSHLFYGYTITGWAFAEEPFKVIWAVRSDGTMLSLTYVKEQEMVGWARHDTNGSFKSVATVVEAVSFGKVDALYAVVQRTINGNSVQYIERMAERIFTGGASDAWCVDAGLQYSGAPATSFSGAEHLAGSTVTGLADGVVIPPFVMAADGTFTLPAASKVTVGLAYTSQLQTLQLDLGEPNVQGKRKKITGVSIRCLETLGLAIGRSFSSLVPMKDLVAGNVGTMTNQLVSGLITGDARAIIDPLWDVPGQYCIEQDNPLPATILGVIPEIVVGDTK